MADSARVTVAKLNNGNYQTWKYKLELLLIKEDLWNFVVEPEPVNPDVQWLKGDGKAKATIGLLIEDNQLVHVRKERTAKGYWEALRKYHQKSSLTNKVFLLKRLCRMQLDESGNMEAHISRMLDTVDQLTGLGEELQEHLVVALLLASVPDSYGVLTTALESRPDSDLTLDLVKEKLIQEYLKRRENGTANENKEAVLNVKGGKRFWKKEKVICFGCGKQGHFKRDCVAAKFEKRRLPYKANQVSENQSEASTSESKERYVCFEAGQGPRSNHWYVDSGATCHMSNDKTFFDELNFEAQGNVFMADGRTLKAKGIGEGFLNCCIGENKAHPIRVKEVLYVPNLDGSLLSVQKLTQRGLAVNFKGDECSISMNGTIVAKANKCAQLYKLDITESALSANSVPKSEHLQTWHRRMGHRDPEAIKMLVNKEMATGIKISHVDKKETCDSCERGKMSRKPFPQQSNSRSKEVLELVHSDLCGPMQTVTPGGNRYFLTLIDDYSRYTVIYFLKNKGDVLEKVKEYVHATQTKFQRKLKVIRSDGGGEYNSSEFDTYLKKEGIHHQVTAPYSPQQNGVAERKNRSLTEMARCMLIDSGMSKRFWGEAVNTANYLQNRLPTRATGMTPYERWYGKLPDLAHIRIFGSTAYALIPKEKRRKLDEKAKQYTFVGYAEGTKAYRLLDQQNEKIHISRDVTFVEKIQNVEKSQTDNLIREANRSENSEEVDEKQNTEVEVSISVETPVANPVSKPVEDQRVVRRSERSTKGIPPERYAMKTEMVELDEPKTLEEAIASVNAKEWKRAMQEEINSMHENETWNLTELPPNKNPIGSKWIFKLKHDSEGNVSRYKARLVAQGFSQKYGDDYDEVFAPVVKQTTLRTFLTVAGLKNMNVKHYDVKTAYLNGDLQEEIYMEQAKGYAEPGKEHLFCKLNKGIYGLKQAARTWNQKINKVLIENNFVRSIADPCLYSKQVNGKWLYLLIYVDDILIASTEEALINETKQLLKKNFKISCLGELKYYIGIQVEKDENNFYCVHQSTYIEKLLKRFGLENAKSSKIPMDPGYMKITNGNEPLPNNDIYRKAIGALLYISVSTRPDIAASVSILSRKISCPTQADWTEVKRVLRYLKGTKNAKLRLGGDKPENYEKLVGYADADWANNTTDRKSNSGYLFKFAGGTVSWASRKQSCVSLSSTEAEYVAISEACQEVKWLKNLLRDFGINRFTPIIYEDNQSCLKMLESEKINPRTKHIEVKYHFAKDMMTKEEVEFRFCPTDEMIADFLTKPLLHTKLKKLTRLMGLTL